MDLAYRSEAKRSRALAVVVAFLAVLFAVSQFSPRRDAPRPAAPTGGARAAPIQHARPARIVDAPKTDHRGVWARKMIGLAP